MEFIKNSPYFQEFNNPPILKNPLFVINPIQRDVTGDGTVYHIQFNQKIYDVANQWDTINHKFVAAETGYYFVQLSIWLTGLSTNYTTFFLKAVKGAFNMILDNKTFNNGCVYGALRLHTLDTIYAKEGEEIIFTLQVLGGTKTIDIAAAFPTWPNSRLQITRIA